MTWEDLPLVTPAEIEDLAVEVLRERHPEHLAAHERRRGLEPETLERLRTVSHLAAQDEVLSGDALPAALLGVVGTSGEPSRNEDDAIDVPLALGMEVAVMGQARRDTLRRRDWIAWTAIECLLQRLPRSEIVGSIRLRDVEPIVDAQAQRIRGAVRVMFEVWVPDALSLLGLPGHADERWPDGAAGGAPATPYAEPVPLPVVAEAEADVDREEVP